MYLTSIYSSRSSTPSNDLQNLRLASCSNLLRSPSSSTTSGSSFMSPMPPPSMPLSHSFQTPKRGKNYKEISKKIVQKLPKDSPKIVPKSLQKSSPKCRHILCHFFIHSKHPREVRIIKNSQKNCPKIITPKIAQRLPKKYPKSTQKVPKKYPKSTQKVPIIAQKMLLKSSPKCRYLLCHFLIHSKSPREVRITKKLF